jgi:hypothetical protein
MLGDGLQLEWMSIRVKCRQVHSDRQLFRTQNISIINFMR